MRISFQGKYGPIVGPLVGSLFGAWVSVSELKGNGLLASIAVGAVMGLVAGSVVWLWDRFTASADEVVSSDFCCAKCGRLNDLASTVCIKCGGPLGNA